MHSEKEIKVKREGKMKMTELKIKKAFDNSLVHSTKLRNQ